MIILRFKDNFGYIVFIIQKIPVCGTLIKLSSLLKLENILVTLQIFRILHKHITITIK
jgi:hypothetical protein